MDQILSSWKEIAAFFGRGVRTVQRWEKDKGLPVFRPSSAAQNIVFARSSELAFWMESARTEAPAQANSAAGEVSAPPPFPAIFSPAIMEPVCGDPMSQVPWFERQFGFTTPVEQFPNLRVRLLGAPARLEELLRGLSSAILTTPPASGKWSPQEEAGHLLDMEPLWLARVDDFLSGDTLTPADLTNRRTFDASHNTRDLGTIVAGFRSARLALTSRLAALPPESFSRSLLHPRLRQPMRLVDHLYFIAEHDDHHLAHLWTLTRPPQPVSPGPQL
jgi:uncharacterized damage-inducible protein DinB